jgi:transcription termination factor Rho
MLLGPESESMENIIERLRKTKTNEEFLEQLKNGD